MRVYHTTNHAEAILAQGFKDGEGLYMTRQAWRGVWLASRPLDEGDLWGIGDTTLVLEIPEEILTPWEWVQEGHDHEATYREFLVPAEIVNQYGPPQVHIDD